MISKPSHHDFLAGVVHHRIAAHDIQLHAVEAGSGPLMILLSGWPQTWYSWHKVMPSLAEHFRVVAVDLPGLGESDFPRDGYDTASIALHLDSVLDAFKEPSCILIGHDVGAWVAYAYAARRASRVSGLVLIDAAIPGLASPDAFRFSPETARKVWHFYFNYMPDLSELLVAGREQDFLNWSFRTKSHDWRNSFDERALGIYADAYAAPGRWSGGMGYYRAIFESIEQNQKTASTPLTMPVLAIGGEMSLGANMERALSEVATHVVGAIITDCGHYVPEEKPEELLSILRAFISEHPV